MTDRKTKAKIISHSSTGRTLTVNLEIKFPIDKWNRSQDVLRRLKTNKNWIPEHLGHWADWDYGFTIDLLVESLERLGRGLLKWNNSTTSLKHGRRALFAAKRLKKLADDGQYYHMDDKSMENWTKRHRRIDVPLKSGLIEWRAVYDYDNAMGMDREEYSNKMYKIITKRMKQKFEPEWADTWAYIGKWIRYWWD